MRIVQFTTDNREPHKQYSNPEPWFGMAPDALLQGFSTFRDMEFHVISCVRQPVATPPRIYGSIHYHSVVVPKSGWASTLYQGCIRATRKLVREINPDIVHGQGTERESSLCAVYSGYPNVLTIHGNMAELNRLGTTFRKNRGYGRLVSALETHALAKTSGVFCNSAYTESLVAPRTRLTWRVPNPIRNAFLRAAGDTASPANPPQLLNIGLITPRKRQLEILRCIRGLHQQGLRFKVLFAGGLTDDDYGTAFKSELVAAEAAGYAEYLGFLGEEELIRIMDESCGFIHFPSEEAFGLVVAEAMARGLKFFGSRVGGIVEIADQIPGAELHDTFEALQQGIGNWLTDGAKRQPGALEEISRRYSPEAVAKQHLEIYQSVLTG